MNNKINDVFSAPIPIIKHLEDLVDEPPKKTIIQEFKEFLRDYKILVWMFMGVVIVVIVSIIFNWDLFIEMVDLFTQNSF